MDDTLTIRPATPADLTALDALYARAYPRLLRKDYPPSVQVAAIPLISRANPVLLRTGTFHVAEQGDGRLVGAGGWTRLRGTGRGEVRHVVTDDRMTRQGIGRAILTRILDEARTAGLAQIDCQATRTAVPFYRALGFQELGPILVPLRRGIEFPAVAMVKKL